MACIENQLTQFSAPESMHLDVDCTFIRDFENFMSNQSMVTQIDDIPLSFVQMPSWSGYKSFSLTSSKRRSIPNTAKISAHSDSSEDVSSPRSSSSSNFSKSTNDSTYSKNDSSHSLKSGESFASFVSETGFTPSSQMNLEELEEGIEADLDSDSDSSCGSDSLCSDIPLPIWQHCDDLIGEDVLDELQAFQRKQELKMGCRVVSKSGDEGNVLKIMGDFALVETKTQEKMILCSELETIARPTTLYLYGRNFLDKAALYPHVGFSLTGCRVAPGCKTQKNYMLPVRTKEQIEYSSEVIDVVLNSGICKHISLKFSDVPGIYQNSRVRKIRQLTLQFNLEIVDGFKHLNVLQSIKNITDREVAKRWELSETHPVENMSEVVTNTNNLLEHCGCPVDQMLLIQRLGKMFGEHSIALEEKQHFQQNTIVWPNAPLTGSTTVRGHCKSLSQFIRIFTQLRHSGLDTSLNQMSWKVIKFHRSCYFDISNPEIYLDFKHRETKEQFLKMRGDFEDCPTVTLSEIFISKGC